MGSFYSNIHVKTNLGRDEFIEGLSSRFLKANYERCGEGEALFSYRLAFSDGWVTFVRPEYRDQPDVLEKEAKNISASFNTSVFTTTVVDSDFAELSLYDNGEQADYVVIGEADAYGLDETPADPAKWQPLLKQGTAFRELSAVWETDEVFCEDALYKSAPLFGIEPDFMTADDRSLDDKNSVLLCFRETASPAAGNSAIKLAPKPTLATAFKNAFGEALEPLGFRYFHYKKDELFVKVIGGEIMQVITYTDNSFLNRKKGVKSFTVCTRMITVYECPLKVKEHDYFWPTPYLSNIYTNMHPEKKYDELDKKMFAIAYDPDDSADIVRAVEEALTYTMRIAIPYYRRVTDLTSYLLINREIGASGAYIYMLENCRNKSYLENQAEDELLYVKTRYSGDFLEFLRSEEDYTEMVSAVKARGFSPVENPYPRCNEPYSKYHSDYVKNSSSRRELLDSVLNDPELCALVNAELDRRKAVNTESLAKIGIKL